MNHSTTNFGDG